MKYIHLIAPVSVCIALMTTHALAVPASFGIALCTDPVRDTVDTTPTSRFIEQDGEITDRQTGLIWKRCPVGYNFVASSGNKQCIILSYPYSFSIGDALRYHRDTISTNPALAGWRIPSIKELGSITNEACGTALLPHLTFPQGNVLNANVVSSSVTPFTHQQEPWDSVQGYLLKFDKSRMRVNIETTEPDQKGLLYLVKDPH